MSLIVVLAGATGGGPHSSAQAPATAVPAAIPAETVNYGVGNSLDDRDLADMRRASARAAAQASAQALANASEQALKAPASPATGERTKDRAAAAPVTKKKPAGTPARASRSGRSAAAAAPVDGSRASVVIAYALAQRGKPYRFGATGPGAFDCSGLLLRAFEQVGIYLPRRSGDIAARGRPVSRAQWQPGDVLAWPGHVALYLGGGMLVHASRAGVPVKVAPVWGSPIARRLL